MQKNHIKNFICSFLFSILAVITVQKIFLRTPETNSKAPLKQQNIVKHNISLFSEETLEPLKEKTPNLEKRKALPKVADVSEINKLEAVAQIKSLQETPKTAENPIKDLKPEVQTKPDELTDIAFASEITLDVQEIQEITAEKEHIKSGIVYADISDTFQSDSLDDAMAENTDSETSIQTATGAIENLKEEIPLFKGAPEEHKNIHVSDSADSTQIAMLEPNALISTIEPKDILEEEKNLAEADIKKNELGELFDVSQEQEAESSDSPWLAAVAASEESSSDENHYLVDEDPADNPWVVAKGNKFAKNQAVVEEFETINKPEETINSTQDLPAFNNKEDNPEQSQDQPLEDQGPEEKISSLEEKELIEQVFSEPLLRKKETDTKLAYQMIQNILIPIPEDILNDANLTPDLTSSPKEKELQDNVSKTQKNSLELDEKEKQSGLFKSISSWFGKNKNKKQSNSDGEKDQTDDAGKSLLSQASDALKGKIFSGLESLNGSQEGSKTSIMPAELRLSFQPNRAEISGQTLKWIHAFADNARDNDGVYVEVRVDGTSSFALQQKRLNLLSSIFSSRGVDWRKINIIFTSREPNSFIIRNIRFNNKEEVKNNNTSNQPAYHRW